MKNWVLGLILIVVAAFGAYHSYRLNQKLALTTGQLSNITAELLTVRGTLARTEKDNADLTNSLQAERERNDSFFEKIEDISGTVNKLEKIKNTDPELLRKYSKVYFLNENYIPSKLTNITAEYLFNPDQPLLFHAKIWSHLEELLVAATKADQELKIVSAFRSFDSQSLLKTNYLMSYGSGANKFSADQGYSEHQLGTTVDFALLGTEALALDFADTTAYQWLEENAYRFGFALSYPQNNSYYQFEPWHWRFVGLKLARFLHRENKNFYDLTQREIDEYVADFFD